MWFNEMQPGGEYNPIHYHTGCHVSSVLYLKVPAKRPKRGIDCKEDRDGMIEFVDGKEQFLPNIDIELSYGHTIGMMLPKLSDNSEILIYMADLIPMAAHIPLPWIMSYDINSGLTLKEKNNLLPKAVEEDWTIFFEHDPVHEACKVQFDGKHFRLKRTVKISE